MRITEAVVKIDNKYGRVTVSDMEEAANLSDGTVLGFLLGRLRPIGHNNLPVDCDFNDGNDGNVKTKIANFLHKVNNPKIRTPLTRKGVMQWARKEAKNSQAFTDDKGKKHKSTVKLELIGLLTDYNRLQWDGDKAHEVVEGLIGLLVTGTRGYDNYTVNELLDKIETDVIENFGDGYDDLEDLLSQLRT